MFASKKPGFFPAAAAVLAFLVFVPSLTHGWTNFDDPMFLLNETGWRGLGPAAWRWAFYSRVGSVYQPLAWLTYGLDYSLWGLDARGYHLQSALWHALSAALAFLTARRVLEAARPGPSRDLDAAALFAALVFALHPLRVESVSWASERRDAVCCTFVLAAVLSYVRGRGRATIEVFALFLLSLFAKGMALLLPAALLALDFYPLGRIGPRGEEALEAFREKLPLFALSAVFGAAGMAAQHRIRWTYEQHGLTARLAQACYALSFYVWKTILPIGLMPLYELRPPMRPFEPRFVLSVFIAAAAAWACWRQRREKPWLAASAAWYAILLFPVSGLFQFGPQLVADRYSYITTLPLALLAGAGLRAGLVRRRGAALAAAAAVVAGLAAACVLQQSHWRDSETLWARALEGDPECATCQTSLGTLRASQGRFLEAKDRFQLAIDAFPGCIEDQDRLIALLSSGGGSPEELRRLRASVETHPVCRKARANIGAMLAQTGDLPGAVKIFRASAIIDPSDDGVRRNLARALAELNARR